MIKGTPHITKLQIIAPPNSNNHFKYLSTLLNPIKAWYINKNIVILFHFSVN